MRYTTLQAVFKPWVFRLVGERFTIVPTRAGHTNVLIIKPVAEMWRPQPNAIAACLWQIQRLPTRLVKNFLRLPYEERSTTTTGSTLP